MSVKGSEAASSSKWNSLPRALNLTSTGTLASREPPTSRLFLVISLYLNFGKNTKNMLLKDSLWSLFVTMMTIEIIKLEYQRF